MAPPPHKHITTTMGFGNIKRDWNDDKFSEMIRERDGRCVFCGKTAEGGWRLTNSHYWGRGNKTVRFHPLNCDTLCFKCHADHEGNKQGFYREWKIAQLGRKKYDELERLARSKGKYGAWEKAQLKLILQAQYSEKAHLKKGWEVNMP